MMKFEIDHIIERINFEWNWLLEAGLTSSNLTIAFSTLKSVVKELKSKPPWIPVTERLPKKTGKYLVTVRNGNVYAGTFDETSGRFQCAATAWMPLPEAYEGGGTK